MLFNELYRDVYSQINVEGTGHDIYFQDITKALNDSIRTQRRQYVENGLGRKFSTTESLSTFTEATDYSFLNTATLTSSLMDSVGIERSIITLIGFETSNTLTDTVQTFSKGDIALKGDFIVECLNDIAATNTYNLVIPNNVGRIRDFYKGNGLTYYAGEYVYDIENDRYYKVTADVEITDATVASSITEFTEYFWIERRKTFVNVSRYPMEAATHLSVFDEYSDSQGITVDSDKVYLTKGIKKLVMTYVPEWTEVTDLDTDVDIPDFMVPDIKSMALNKLRTKLYKRYAPNTNPEQLEDDEQDN